MMRLDKFLSNGGVGSRKEVKQLLKKGGVRVNDVVIKNPQFQVDEDADSITVYGEEIVYAPFIYIMMNKPQGVISATEDKRDTTVIDLLEPWMMEYQPFPVGRLDKDTEGLLLITNDGKLAHRLLSPRKHVDKKYWVKINTEMQNFMACEVEKGIRLGDGYITKPGKLKIIDPQNGEGFITISEGKYHQIKRMFQAMDAEVIGLKRLEMGTLKLDQALELGEFRLLTEEEVAELQVE